ncbi:hypothetical protein AURDEDRAFT_164945 [Auricularia subglabra TFB-10046 SS5]|nr:hypothetical protein AURDEDRAFT_164945 [Auricularia subglabra TFB-10046 SS5]
MSHLQLGVAIGSRSVDIAGQGIARSVLGVAETIADLCRSMRVNKDAAIALSHRVDELVIAVATELEHMKLQVGTEDWLMLLETQALLAKQVRQTYFQQVLYQERNKGLIKDAAEDVSRALSVLMMQSHVHVSSMAGGVADPIKEAYYALLKVSWRHRSPSPEPDGEVPPLPDPPTRFAGRDGELQAVLEAAFASAQVAIVGAHGVGKTTLALAALHDPAVADRFGERRYFVSFGPCEEHSSYLHMIGQALGLSSRSDSALERKIRRKLSSGLSLLVLDGFETAWAPLEHRAHAESILQRLSEIPELSLIVTLRGSRRPHGSMYQLSLDP